MSQISLVLVVCVLHLLKLNFRIVCRFANKITKGVCRINNQTLTSNTVAVNNLTI